MKGMSRVSAVSIVTINGEKKAVQTFGWCGTRNINGGFTCYLENAYDRDGKEVTGDIAQDDMPEVERDLASRHLVNVTRGKENVTGGWDGEGPGAA